MKMIHEESLIKDPHSRIRRNYFTYKNIVLHFLYNIILGDLQLESR